MKSNKYFWGLALLPMLASCADYLDTDNYIVEKPASIAEFEYLNDYKPLKEYVNRSAHPGFTLGTALSVDDYLKQGSVYLLTNSNFDMMTAGNAMKYASCVDDKGNMNFDKVRSFVDAAEAVGMQIYGHTLLWHSQQNTKWLNSLLADKEIAGGGDGATVWKPLMTEATGENGESANLVSRYPGDSDIAAPVVDDPLGGGLVYKSEIAADPVNPWDSQFFIVSDQPLNEGDHVRISFKYYCTDERNIDTQAHGNPGEYHHWACIGTLAGAPEWKEHSWEGNVDASMAGDNGLISIAFNLSGNPGAATFYVDDVAWEIEAAAPSKIDFPIIDAATGEAECANLISRYPGNGDITAPVVDDPLGTGKVYKSEIAANPVDPWDSQFFIKSNQPLQEGDHVKVSFRYRCTDERNIDTQAHGNPGEYHHWAFIGTLNASPEWKDHSWEGNIDASMAGDSGCLSIAFNLSGNPEAATFFIDDVVWTIEMSGNTMPLTPEEKYDILDAELGRWIKGMMDATGGKVKAWDLMNEGLADTWGDIDLKHQATVPDNNAFYWQDYLGDMYVRNAEKYARQYYAEQENANPADLKLFINDYNLEATYNNNDKAKSLVNWIKKWEEDGVTKIDGIGSQMHISYSCNPSEQAKREEGVVNMLKILAASGKLIRITELDMGIDDENGNAIQTADVTVEQHKAMGEYYRFIINKYFEIVPVDQQFGICHWCQTDSPEGSGWRANTPVGLWNLNLQRKPTYGGYADGLNDN